MISADASHVKIWRIITFTLGFISIYTIAKNYTNTTFFWALILLYILSTIMIWTDRIRVVWDDPRNKYIKFIIIVMTETIMALFIIPGLNLNNNSLELLLFLIVTIYYINTLLETAIWQIIISLYNFHFKRYIPQQISYSIDKFIQVISCIDPVSILIYVGSVYSILPRMETISYPFEAISSDLMIIKNKIADLLPTQINDALTWMGDHIQSLVTIPIVKRRRRTPLQADGASKAPPHESGTR